MRIQGKIALITGAAQRIGREIALTLAQRGAGILIHYNRSHKAALGLKEELEAAGTEVFLVKADLSAKNRPVAQVIAGMVKEIYRLVPRVEILVNNASIFYRTPLGKITEREWDDLLTVNLKAPFFLAQEIGMRMLKQRSGKIINLVDYSILRPSVDYLPYAISKSGLLAATRGLAKALAPYVGVNSIAPGPVLPSRGMTKQGEKKMIQKTLLKRFGHPKDIAETVRFLIEGSDFITGAMIPVDGGGLIV